MIATQDLVCHKCGGSPSKIRLKKDGEPAMPFRWQTADEGFICQKCRVDAPSQNYAYDCWPPGENVEAVEEQFSLAHRYKNKLVEIERARRDQYNAMIRDLWPELTALEAAMSDAGKAIAELEDAVTAANADARRNTATKEQKDSLAEARKRLKQAKKEFGEAKRKAGADPETKARASAIDEAAAAAIKQARAGCGLYWGTYCAVEQSQGRTRSGPPPRFHRWDWSGRLAIQLQNGLSVEAAQAGTDSRLRIERCEPRNSHQKAVSSSGPLCKLWFRVGGSSDEPVVTTLEFRMHRPLPPGAQIKWVYLCRERVATKLKYRLVFVLQWPGARQYPDQAESGTVGVDLGWRLLPDGTLRVATWVGSDGRSGYLTLPPEMVTARDKAESLQSTRDKIFNEAVERLASWLETATVPKWMTERSKALRSWRSQARLASLVLHWRDNRFAGDEEIFRWMDGWQVTHPDGKVRYAGWRKQDKHLYEWQINLLRKTAARREHIYRNFAAFLRRNYATFALEGVNWRDMMKRAAVGDDKDAGATHHYSSASVGKLAEWITETARKTVRVDPKHTTQRCHACKRLTAFDAKRDLSNVCRHCNAAWDQDYNAAANLRDAASGGVVNGTPGAARESDD